MKTLLALILVVAAGTSAAWRMTDGLRAFTTEDGRRLAVARQPVALPDTLLQYADGSSVPLSRAAREDGRATVVVFFYARCNTVCSVTGSAFQNLQETIRARGLGARVRLLSISFDGRDDRAALSDYARRMRADGSTWQVARIADAAQRDALLAACGITVIPAPLGEFQHNAAFHVVASDGRLVRIVDYERPDDALAQALAAGGGAA